MFNTDELTAINTNKEVVTKVTYKDLIHINRTLETCENYSDFTSDKYPHGFIFYDFEVFKWDWLVVLIDPIEKTKTVIANDRAALQKYFDNNCNKIWVGYNNKHYDIAILKGILLGMNPKEISDEIILHGKQPFEISKDFRKIKVLSYDIMIQIVNAPSLKTFEAYMGNDIEETSVPFDIQRPLTKAEMYMTMKYCVHDVEQTIEVFRRKIDDYNGITSIVEMFDFPFDWIIKTKGQLTALVVDCEKQEHNDEFDVTILPCIQLEKYAYVRDWFVEMTKNKSYQYMLPNTPEYAHILSKGAQVRKKDKGEDTAKTAFQTMIAGIPHQFGWGGVHGAADKPVHIKGKMYHLDVTSFYPSLMIVYGLFTRNAKKPWKFKEVYDLRVALKKAGKKKEQAPLKIILNSQYGITKAKVSAAYDPVQANNICLNGQLMLLDLIEHLEKSLGDKFELIQSNTDGIIIRIPENDDMAERKMKHVCKEWSLRTGMGLGEDILNRYIAKDVNNYIFVFDNGKLERKGKYVKELSDLDNDLPIVNRAVVDYITKDIPVEDTINASTSMIDFQMIVRISKEYKLGWHNGEELSEKTFRVYASTDRKDTYIGKCREHGSNPDKFANTPDNCFVYNKDVKNIPLSIKLDKQWYIDLARKRLTEYGYEMPSKFSLF